MKYENIYIDFQHSQGRTAWKRQGGLKARQPGMSSGLHGIVNDFHGILRRGFQQRNSWTHVEKLMLFFKEHDLNELLHTTLSKRVFFSRKPHVFSKHIIYKYFSFPHLNVSFGACWSLDASPGNGV